MIVLGLTGSIGMGKTTAAGEFRRLGVPVLDSDQTVHRLLGRNGAAVGPVAGLFPETLVDQAIDRQLLGQRVFGAGCCSGDLTDLDRLEAVLHPLVRVEQVRFLQRCARGRTALALLDIPLLYETGAEGRCDAVVITTAPAFVQRQRVLARPRMSVDRYRRILARQMPDRDKRRRADFIIMTGLGRAWALRQIRQIIRTLSVSVCKPVYKPGYKSTYKPAYKPAYKSGSRHA